MSVPYALMFISGLLSGALLLMIFLTLRNAGCLEKDTRVRQKPVGTIQIIQPEDEDPYMFLSLETDVENLAKERLVTVRVSYKKTSQK